MMSPKSAAIGPSGALGKRVDLQATDTPLYQMDRISAHLGLPAGSLWVKRDDLGGFAGGGNKCRKMEFHAAAIRASGADVVVTGGAPQSNHLRVTAATCARLGMDCVITIGAGPARYGGNLLLDQLFGASVRWLGARPVNEYADMQREIVEELRRSGRRPYVIPVGGSDSVGDLGYVRCAAEIASKLPTVRRVWCAVGSGGTAAGLLAGFGGGVEIVGVPVADPDMEDTIIELYGDVCQVIRQDIAVPSLRLVTSFAGRYGEGDPRVYEAIALAARQEGILLDPVYAGRAFAAMIGSQLIAASPPEEATVFIHTGGAPALFSQPYASGLADYLESEGRFG
jgi:1-aminocyclopropane-1-carboxylate deaminase/D-cysteine desulfhydrase-like pyridoxal-dependent ACC family enzyme